MGPDGSALLGRPARLAGQFTGPVTVETIPLLGSGALLQVRTAEGRLEEVALSHAELGQVATTLPYEPHPRRLFLCRTSFSWWDQSSRRRLELLVYGNLLPQARLRFSLTDDPGFQDDCVPVAN